jgi:hypothetical protein
MSPNLVLTTHALISIGFAIPLILGPGDFLALYGAPPDAFGLDLARMLGAVLVALAALTWLTRDAPEGALLDAICGALAIGALAGLATVLYIQLTSEWINALGWTNVLAQAGLFAAYTALYSTRGARRPDRRLQAG